MLSAAELADMRAVQTLTFDQVATVTRRVLTPDGTGGQTASNTTSILSCCAGVWYAEDDARRAVRRIAGMESDVRRGR